MKLEIIKTFASDEFDLLMLDNYPIADIAINRDWEEIVKRVNLHEELIKILKKHREILMGDPTYFKPPYSEKNVHIQELDNLLQQTN